MADDQFGTGSIVAGITAASTAIAGLVAAVGGAVAKIASGRRSKHAAKLEEKIVDHTRSQAVVDDYKELNARLTQREREWEKRFDDCDAKHEACLEAQRDCMVREVRTTGELAVVMAELTAVKRRLKRVEEISDEGGAV